MTSKKSHICVCICTFKRPQLLGRLLEELERQNTRDCFSYSVVVADNDRNRSAETVSTGFARSSALSVTYCVEPEQNIALARNRALENATGDYLAFIDDDEYPSRDWLYQLFTTCQKTGATGVLGPVLPYFEQEPPQWAIKGRFFERPSHVTGEKITIKEARTGNVLLRKSILNGSRPFFNQAFGTGGEDIDFFRNLMARGCSFVWCNEAPVYEVVQASRCTRSYLLRRSLLRGSISCKLAPGPLRVMKSLIAVLLYGLSLPILLIAGEHYFLKYLMKLCDHAGLILGFLRLNPVSQRDP